MGSDVVSFATRVFSLADQQSFARWSGDRNPMHLDALAARRTQAGAPVVHGMNALLWALEQLFEKGQLAAAPMRVEGRFKRFLYVGEPIELRSGLRGRFDLVAGGGVAATLTVAANASTDPPPLPGLPAQQPPLADEPAELEFGDLAGRSGALRLPDQTQSWERYPALTRAIGASAVAALASLSTLVGMHVPGLHSIFDGVDLCVVAGDASALAYAVVEVDDRFRLVTLHVRGAGLDGEVRAFLRQPPVGADRAALAGIAADEFAGTRALVIGGSRGLGAATVRALAAGGATVTLTYARGESEARALVRELGGRVTALQLDVTRDLEAVFATIAEPFDHVYYFATPHIARRTVQWFSSEAFDAFNDVYVRGFARACAAIHARSPKVRIYYPSSVAVDFGQRPREMLEYAMAKSAGEALCADIPRSLRGVRVEVERLPRVATDQTATIVPVEAASAERLALAAIRRMHANT